MTSHIVIWPEIRRADLSIESGTVYCGAMGFEDRALAFLEQTRNSKQKLDTVFAIEYSPFNEKNKKREFLELANQVSSDVRILHYDRFSPENFSRAIPDNFKEFRSKKIVIDISGLSKLGIVILLYGLADHHGQLRIFYTEAKVYHPTPEEFEKEKAKVADHDTPAFLTTWVEAIVGTASLSSVSMPGSPLALVAFPTFNHVELGALLNEITPQRLFILRGVPPSSTNQWRFDATKQLNSGVMQYTDDERRVSTLDYRETIDALQDFYRQVRYSHRLVVAPTGSKMESVAVAFFKLIQPDVQVVYPVAKGFASEYSDGWQNPWQIDFDHFDEFTASLRLQRKQEVLELISLLRQKG